jgi:hypothetical protein
MKDLTSEDAVQKFISIVKAQDQVDCPVYHHFSPGLYIRELNVPADTVLVGYKQKTEHLNIFLKGCVVIVNDGEIVEMKAPMIFTGNPGRKVGYVKEDMSWLNVYATTETDIETLEEMFLDKTDSWTKEELQALNKVISRNEDREDYEAFLKDTGLTEEQVREESEFVGDQIAFPPGMYGVGVFPSPIEGRGLFANAPYIPGQYIAPARVSIYRTPAGRYTNHAKDPNAKLVLIKGDLHLIATKFIRGNQGGILGDEITIDYRESLKFRPKGV